MAEEPRVKMEAAEGLLPPCWLCLPTACEVIGGLAHAFPAAVGAAFAPETTLGDGEGLGEDPTRTIEE